MEALIDGRLRTVRPAGHPGRRQVGTVCAAPPSGCRSPDEVVHRFVPGETVADAMNSVAAAAGLATAWSSIDYLGEDVTDADAADATVRGLPRVCSTRSASRDEAPAAVRAARGVAEAVRARAGAAARRREDRPGERAHHLRDGAARRGLGDRRRRGPHHHRLDAVDRAGPARRLPLARHRAAGLPEAHRGRLRGVRGLRGADPVVQGRLRRAGVGGLPRHATTSPTPTCGACAS